MDYKTYLDLVLALENRSQPASIHFFFKIFDIDHKGYLDNFTMRFFLRAILEVVNDPMLKVSEVTTYICKTNPNHFIQRQRQKNKSSRMLSV